MGKARNYTEVKKEYGDDLGDFAKKITEIYVRSALEYSQSQLAKDNDITLSCVRRLMDYAISEGKVSREYAEKVMQKSIANQQRKHAEAGGSSIRHHNELMEQRNESIAKKLDIFEVEDIIKSAIALEDDFELVLDSYQKLECKRALYKVFERAITSLIASDEEADKLMELIRRKYPGQKAIIFCNRLMKERNDVLDMLS